MSPQNPRDPTGKINRNDLDDVIGIAAEMAESDADRISTEDAEKVGQELDIPPEYIARAAVELEARRKKAAEEAALKRHLRRRNAAGGIVIVIVLVLFAWKGGSSQRAFFNQVELQRAQLASVIQSQQVVSKRYLGQIMTPEADAEMSGAENRVRIERQRYDEAAVAYNNKAGSFPGSLWSVLFGLPSQIPLSNQLEEK